MIGREQEMRLHLYEDDDIEDVIEDDEDFDEILSDDLLIDELDKISKNLGISGRVDNNTGDYKFSISSTVKVIVEIDGGITGIRTEIKKDRPEDKNVYIDCFDDTTELSNLSDYLNTATLLIKDIQDKLL